MVVTSAWLLCLIDGGAAVIAMSSFSPFLYLYPLQLDLKIHILSICLSVSDAVVITGGGALELVTTGIHVLLESGH